MADSASIRASGRLWSEPGEDKIIPIAQVVPIAPIDKIYSFAIPDVLLGKLAAGQRAQVPVGKKKRLIVGFVLKCTEQRWHSTLKYIHSLVDTGVVLHEDVIELGRWMSQYYGTPLGKTLSAMVPAAVRARSGYRTVRYLALQKPLAEIEADCKRLSATRKRLIDLLSQNPDGCEATMAMEQSQVSRFIVREMIKKQWMEERVEKQPQSAPNFDEPIVEPEFALNDSQRSACRHIADCLEKREFKVVLLYGVSGSGKTEVYIDAMKRVIAEGRQAIVLVPEIALTTQLVYRFTRRFKDVAVIHSGLSGVERSLTWNAIATGQKRVILGTRSAIFAPCRQLGLIVVDEEQEGSYKNQQSPRFHARDVAIMRAQQLGIPIILGSATPSLETWHNCESKGHYVRIRLDHRVSGLELPQVELVDMRYEEGQRSGFHLLSRLLEMRLSEALLRQEQAVLLLNRRGYANVLYCPRCKTRVLCHACKASMVFHRSSGLVMCHHCYSKMTAPRYCSDPSCGGELIRFGVGTERAEEELRRKFPSARIQRVDSDTMENIETYRQVVRAFENRELDILIGTQMIAKGLDFPFVSLVGVVSADTALFSPDFRANETTFQLVTQVAGRAGRSQTEGRVVVQTVMGDLPALQAAMHHDYDRFVIREMQIRRKTHMPPFGRLVRWVLSDPMDTQVRMEAERFANRIKELSQRLGLTGATILGPTPSAIERIRKLYRYDVLLRTETVSQRQEVLDYLRREKLLKVLVKRMIIDVDPVSLL